MPFETLLPLMRKTQSPLSPEEFHKAVNVTFHNVEAESYDVIHSDMRDSLLRQMQLLVADAGREKAFGQNLHLLDIGCGTGMSTELLLKTDIGPAISKITLVDTSPEMLSKAAVKAKTWNREVDFHCGNATELNDKFNVVVICSVLHHIPDNLHFLTRVATLQPEGGILIHLQDPNGDYLNNTEFLNREQSIKPNQIKSVMAHMLPKKMKTALSKMLRGSNYIDEVNARLIQSGAIKQEMSPEETWSVTDIHVDNLPYSIGNGVSFSAIGQTLENYKNAGFRSYGFFGKLESELPENLKGEERKLIASNQQNGRYFGAAWIKTAIE